MARKLTKEEKRKLRAKRKKIEEQVSETGLLKAIKEAEKKAASARRGKRK